MDIDGPNRSWLSNKFNNNSICICFSKTVLKKCPFFNYRGLESSDLARRASPFAPFSAFRPVAKIGDILQLNQDSPNIQDSGEICEVSTTVDKDEDSEHDQQKTRKSNSVQDEVIDVETEEKAKEVKSEPQVTKVKTVWFSSGILEHIRQSSI